MDFMKLLKSIEELLYELITWFVFYPLTFWRIIRHPIVMLTYAQKELSTKDGVQFDDAVSPPILLLLTLVLLHVTEGMLSRAPTAILPTLLQDDRNLLLFRALAFSLFPLLYATIGLRVGGARLTRSTLKPAFYSQSYATVPFVLALNASTQLLSHGQQLGWLLMVAGIVWYVAVETVWLATSRKMSRVAAFFLTLAVLLTGMIALILVAVAVAISTGRIG